MRCIESALKRELQEIWFVSRHSFRCSVLVLTRTTVLCWLLTAAVLVLPMVSRAYAQPTSEEPDEVAAENFVRTDLEKGLSILSDRTISDAERRANLQTYLASFIDFRRIALFSLGVARQYATPAQVDQFVDAFRNYVTGYYGSMLTRYYSGQVLRVTGCMRTGENSYVLTTLLVDPTKAVQRRAQPIEADLRVVDDGGRLNVADVAVGGIWLGMRERDRMNDYITSTNGNIGGLIVHLRAMTNQGGMAPPRLPKNEPETQSP
jgi:ABC-type transporter MlaC component